MQVSKQILITLELYLKGEVIINNFLDLMTIMKIH
jgi:hypothetical protein